LNSNGKVFDCVRQRGDLGTAYARHDADIA